MPAVLLCLPRLLSLLLLLRVDVPCALRLEQDRPEVGRTDDGEVSGVLTRAPGLHLIPGPGLRRIRGEQDLALGVDYRVGDSPGKLFLGDSSRKKHEKHFECEKMAKSLLLAVQQQIKALWF